MSRFRLVFRCTLEIVRQFVLRLIQRHGHLAAVHQRAKQQLVRERFLQVVLNHTRHRTGTHRTVVAFLGQPVAGLLAHFQRYAFLVQLYLQLDDDARAMLKMASDNFDKVVVLLNTQNPMELADLEDDSIDAVMWIGSLGQTGAGGVAEALNGTVNPSGHLPDTYAYDLKSAPSSANFGSYAIVNGTDRFTSSYMAYAEGIYVGYRYYETRYEDVVLGNEARSNYDYTKQVAYPFGYGLSYTDFTWSDYSMKKADGGFDISVKVTNTGKTAGKDVVQLYIHRL